MTQTPHSCGMRYNNQRGGERMVITYQHLLAVVLIVFWLAVIYGIIMHAGPKQHREEKDDRRDWPLRHV
jgi:hypothetical protein